MEIYSIDEAFLSLAGFRSKNFAEYAATIRATVKRWTGLPLSIGIAETKTLSKIAGDVAKKMPGGLFDLLTSPNREILFGQTDVADVWGIGKAYTWLLQSHGITTALQLCQAADQFIRRHMGIVGLRLVMELRGLPCLELEQCPPKKKGITCARSFGKAIIRLQKMEERYRSM